MQGRGVAGGELYAKSKKTMDQAKASGWCGEMSAITKPEGPRGHYACNAETMGRTPARFR